MRNFIWGIVITIVVIIVVGAGLALLGYLPTNANATPPGWEKHVAMTALDASMERKAPRVNNPVPATDENLIEGIKIYTMNCALCHGGLDRKPGELSHAMYPQAPSLILQPLDDPEWHVFYAVRTGVRYTGMPAWEKVLSQDDIWKVTAFLTRVEKLPPAVQDYWQKTTGVSPPTEGQEKHKHSEHE